MSRLILLLALSVMLTAQTSNIIPHKDQHSIGGFDAIVNIGATLLVSDHSWSQDPGGSLIIGANTVTLTPCPNGVAGANTNHIIRITDSTSGNENDTITDGTCIPGATSGTIQFTSTIAHTAGQWTIGTATGGLEEVEQRVVSGDTVYINRDVTTYAVTTIKTGGVQWRGASGAPGAGSRVRPQTASQTVFEVAIAVGFAELVFADFEVDSRAVSGTTAFNAVNQNNVTWRGMFFRENRAIHIDRGRSFTIRDTVIGDSYFVFESTLDSDHVFELVMDNVSDFEGVAFTGTGPIIQCTRCINGGISNVNLSIGDVRDGIFLSNDCQGFSITDSTLVNPKVCLRLERTTIGSDTKAPTWTRITNLMCDGTGDFGIDLENGARYTTISKFYGTNGAAGQTAGVRIKVGASETQILGSQFQNPPTGNLQIAIEAGVSDWSITGSRFDTATGATAVFIAVGASNRYIFSGNGFAGAGTFLTNGATGADRQIFGNTPSTLEHVFSGNIGVNLSPPGNPAALLDVDDEALAEIQVTSYGNQANIVARRANGTRATPTAVTAGQTLAEFKVEGHNGTVFQDGPRWDFTAVGTWSGTNEGSNARLAVTPQNATTPVISLIMSDGGDLTLPVGLYIPQQSATEPEGCVTANRGAVYYDTTDEELCTCRADGTDTEWVKQTDPTHTGHCTI